MSEAARRNRGVNIFGRFRKRSERVGWSGRGSEFLERIAPVTRSSSIRRGIQVGCLRAFLYAFFDVCWPYAETFNEATFGNKESFKVELFLLIDPLVGLSTALAGRFVNPATLWWTAAIMAACLLVPRGFCGYLCPLGTLIDGFDWLVGRRLRRWQVRDGSARGWWVQLKYYLGAILDVSPTTACLPQMWLNDEGDFFVVDAHFPRKQNWRYNANRRQSRSGFRA